jgi:hypothetical protein
MLSWYGINDYEKLDGEIERVELTISTVDGADAYGLTIDGIVGFTNNVEVYNYLQKSDVYFPEL